MLGLTGVRLRFCAFFFCAIWALGSEGRAAWAADAAQSACDAGQTTSYPRAAIGNGPVKAVVYLPDAKTGYYRGTRFDWSGVVGCLTYQGHSYFGVWFPHYDPYLHDAIAGPVEEFRSGDGDGALGYDAARPGDPFVKIGVGVLRRIDDKPFFFGTTYPVIDGGQWTARASANGVEFEQRLESPIGIAYDYRKNLKLDAREPVLILEHSLKNTGTVEIDTQVYDHDFYVLDHAPTGPDMVVRFPFAPVAAQALASGGQIVGKELRYGRPLQTGEAVYSALTGFSSAASDYDFVVENLKTGVGVEQTGSLPLSRVVFWSIPTTICPEGYVHLKIAPGETAHWTIRYRFFAR